MSQVMVTMPMELSGDMLRAVRKDPLTSFADKDTENAHIGWLLCAWDVMVKHRQAARSVPVVPLSDPPSPIETIEYWLDAYANPAKDDDHFQGHGMVVKLLGEYLELRRRADGVGLSAGQPNPLSHAHDRKEGP